MDMFISSGESSGDVLASKVVRELRQISNVPWKIAGIVGRETEKLGVRNLLDSTKYATVGLHGWREWVDIYPSVRDTLRQARPRVLLAITNQVFNAILAKDVSEVHSILLGPSELWVWQPSMLTRIAARLAARRWTWPQRHDNEKLRQAVQFVANRGEHTLSSFDELYCMFRMNHDCYRKVAANMGKTEQDIQQQIRFVGHPCGELSRTDEFTQQGAAVRNDLGIPASAAVVGLFPGSRINEIQLLLPQMAGAAIRAAAGDPERHIVISVLDGRFEKDVREILGRVLEQDGRPRDLPDNIHLSAAPARAILAGTSFAVLCSGTLTLEAASYGVPGVVVYALKNIFTLRLAANQGRVSPGGEKVPYALPNAILAFTGRPKEQRAYDELMGRNFTVARLAGAIENGLKSYKQKLAASESPLLDAEVVQVLNEQIRCPSQDTSSMRYIAKSILSALERNA